jgi:hypothetical protein
MKTTIRDHLLNKLGGENNFIANLQQQGINDRAMNESIASGRITFGQLKKLKEKFGPIWFKDLTVVATQITVPLLAHDFSTLTNEHQDTPIVDAVRGSMSIPGIFKVYEIKNTQGKSFGYFTDGGTLRNLPLPKNKNGLDLSVLPTTLIIRCNDPTTVAQDVVDAPLYNFFENQLEAKTLKLYAAKHAGYAATHVITVDTSALPYVNFLADEQGAIIKGTIQQGTIASARIFPSAFLTQLMISLQKGGLQSPLHAHHTSGLWAPDLTDNRTTPIAKRQMLKSRL